MRLSFAGAALMVAIGLFNEVSDEQWLPNVWVFGLAALSVVTGLTQLVLLKLITRDERSKRPL